MDLGAVFFIVFIMSYANQWLPGCINIYILFFVLFCFFGFFFPTLTETLTLIAK